MKVNIICCLFVLVNEKNTNIRKNDLKKIMVVVNRKDKSLLSVKFDGKTDIKKLIRNHVAKSINSNIFHLEQVYTLGDDKYLSDGTLDIIYIGVTNSENVDLSDNYELINFHVENNNIIKDTIVEKKLLELLIAYKYLRTRIENTDIIFKFMAKYFTLEDVRLVYELIKETNVDKSNFRKKIIKYCEEAEVDITKKGYRPSKMYTFKVLKGDIWL